MQSLFATLTGTVSAHPNAACAVVFLLALSESIPVIGAVVPGTAVIVGIAALVPQGAVGLWPLLLAATSGAVLGDGVSFWAGHRHQGSLLERWPLGRYPELLARSEAFFQRHGGKSVFLARFAPGIRAFVPLVAGILGMPTRAFYLANVLSALIWAPAHILPGVFVGAYVHHAGAPAGRLAALALLIAVLLWGTMRLVRYASRRGMPVLLEAVARARAWAAEREGWFAHALRALLDPSRHEARVLAALGVVLVGAGWLFFGILEDVVSGDPLVRADVSVHGLLQGLRSPLGDSIMIAVTELGDSAVTLPIGVGVFVWLAWRRAWRAAFYWAAAVGCASALNTGIKAVLHRARPIDDLYSGWSAFSFPSGHSTENVAVYGFLLILGARHLTPAWRLIAAFAMAGFVAVIAFSRIYLGAHWLSDVVGGLAFATAWVALLGIAYLIHETEPRKTEGLLPFACLLLVIAGGYNVHRHHGADVERYAVREQAPTLAAAAWLDGDWRQFPSRRVDLEGEQEEPITVQYGGDLARLAADLGKAGWHASTPWSLTGALAWFTAKGDPMALPVLPYLERGELPVLTMVHSWNDRAGVSSRLVLRLWAADVRIRDDGAKPLWMGSVVEEHLSAPFSIMTLAETQPSVDAPRDCLATALSGGRLETRHAPSASRGWDGRVLLALSEGGSS